MEGKVNQYYFDERQNFKIVITEEIYARLIGLTQLTRVKKEEQMCLLLGKEMKNNVVLFDRMNQKTDYKSFGGGSENEFEHGIEMGDGELKEELKEWIEGHEEGAIICDIHTHPSGVNGDDINYRMLSNRDLLTEMKRSELLNNEGIQSIAGMIAVDRERGNSTISFVWFDRQNNKFYRMQNLLIAKYDEQSKKYKFEPLKRQGNSEFIEIGFRPTVECSKGKEPDR